MNKFILSICFISLAISGMAQDEDPIDDKKKKKCIIMLTLMGAANFSGIGGESESYDGGLAGANIGLEIPLFCMNNRISFHSGLNFSMQGSKYKSYQYEPGGGGSSNGDNSLRLNYLVMPVTARLTGKSGFQAEAGLQPGLLLSAKDKHNGNSTDAKDQYNGFDLGLVAGIGYKAPKSSWGFGLRFVPGLTNINKESGMYSVKDRNWAASLRLSYSLPL
jgi:hypothetical protein